jgi:D-glycero-D-manno-heptose 1,7-bisphosphate phosphatase
MAEPRLPGVFMDRDGVLVEEVEIGAAPGELRILPGVPTALARMAGGGFTLVVATNQTVVARGLATEAQVDDLHRALATWIAEERGPTLTHFYVCPHHPSADLERYRVDCDCRKPRPGLLLRAAGELDLDLGRSYMIGDRLSDIAAGAQAGCRTVLVRTGARLEPPIESPDPPDPGLRADWECDDLEAAADWILGGSA